MLSDPQGQVIFQQGAMMEDGLLLLDLSYRSTLPDGLYWVQVFLSDRIYEQQVVIEN